MLYIDKSDKGMIRDSATSQVLGIENNFNLTGTKVILEANDENNESPYHYWIRSVSDTEGFFTLTNSGTGKVLTVLDSGVVISGMYLSYWKANGSGNKEGCNWGHGLSAAIKLGSLEKTVGDLSLHSGVYHTSPFFVEKTALLNILPS